MLLSILTGGCSVTTDFPASAPGIFQWVMEGILKDIPGVVVHLDDILVTERTDTEHLKSLEETLSWLERAGLKLQKEKCNFIGALVAYLGYQIDKGLHLLADKVKALKQAPDLRISQNSNPI